VNTRTDPTMAFCGYEGCLLSAAVSKHSLLKPRRTYLPTLLLAKTVRTEVWYEHYAEKREIKKRDKVELNEFSKSKLEQGISCSVEGNCCSSPVLPRPKEADSRSASW